MNVYLQETRALEATLLGLTGGGKLGEIFSRQHHEPDEARPRRGLRCLQH